MFDKNFADPIIVGDARYPEFAKAVFPWTYEAMEWCRNEAPKSWYDGHVCGENHAVAIVNGRLIRARDCITTKHFLAACRKATDGEAVGESAAEFAAAQATPFGEGRH